MTNNELLQAFNRIRYLSGNIKNKRAQGINRICDKMIDQIIDSEVKV